MPWEIVLPFFASTIGAALTRSDMKKENARVLAANKAEQERIFQRNKMEADRLNELRKNEMESVSLKNEQGRANFYKNLVRDAESAGINPLTALRTGGGSAYATSVAGTVRTPVMRDGVYLEGVMDKPVMTRNPLASGIEAGTNAYMNNLTRRKDYSHDVKMAELRSKLNRADQLAIQKVIAEEDNFWNKSPGGNIPPRNKWWEYERKEDGSLRMFKGEPIKKEVQKSVKAHAFMQYPIIDSRTGKQYEHLTVNVDQMEAGPGESITSSALHGFFAGTSEATAWWTGQYKTGKTVNGVSVDQFPINPYNDGWLTRMKQKLYPQGHPWNLR